MKRTVLVKRCLHLKQRETLSTEPRADFSRWVHGAFRLELQWFQTPWA
jgi:hypothetical protein